MHKLRCEGDEMRMQMPQKKKGSRQWELRPLRYSKASFDRWFKKRTHRRNGYDKFWERLVDGKQFLRVVNISRGA